MSNDSSGRSDEGDPIPTGFIITSADSAILQQYLADFEHADKAARARIVQWAMAKLYLLRPPHTAFDKAEAGQVTYINVQLNHMMTTICFRKSGDGFTIALILPDTSTPSSHGDGPPKAPSITLTVMKLLSLQKIRLDLCRDTRSSWVCSRMLLPVLRDIVFQLLEATVDASGHPLTSSPNALRDTSISYSFHH
jgi:hypothetical protein